MTAINSEWTTVRIGDLGEVVTGGTPSSKKPEFFGDSYPFITPTDMDEAFRYIETDRHLSDDGRLNQIRRQLPAGAICFVCIGATIGKVCMTQTLSFSNQQINSVITDSKRHDGFFVYYLFSTLKERIKGIATGTATPIVNKSSFSDIEVSVPSKTTQGRIAAILSAYDDLIENNLRRIKILEEMAQSLYHEWFVKFRFPSHEQTRMIDSTLGKIPNDWSVSSLGHLSILRKSKYMEAIHANMPLLDLAKMLQRSLLVGSMGNPAELSSSRILFKEDDVLFGSIRPYLHKVALAPCDGVTNVSVLVIKPNEVNFRAMLAILLSSIDVIRWADQHSTGTKMPVIKWERFSDMPIILPDGNTLTRFQEIVWPMLQSIKTASRRIKNLRETRDLLLPKLISGELDVSELDIDIRDAA